MVAFLSYRLQNSSGPSSSTHFCLFPIFYAEWSVWYMAYWPGQSGMMIYMAVGRSHHHYHHHQRSHHDYNHHYWHCQLSSLSSPPLPTSSPDKTKIEWWVTVAEGRSPGSPWSRLRCHQVIVIMVTQQIPTMTNSHHGGFLSAILMWDELNSIL